MPPFFVRRPTAFLVEVVKPFADEVEHILVRHGTAVPHLVRRGIGLDPHVVVADDPALALHRNGEAVRDQQQLLASGPQAGSPLILRPAAEPASGLLVLAASGLPPAAPIRVAQVDPQAARIFEDSYQAAKHLDQPIQIFLRVGLQAKLAFHTVVALTVERRRRDDAVNLMPVTDQPIGTVQGIGIEDRGVEVGVVMCQCSRSNFSIRGVTWECPQQGHQSCRLSWTRTSEPSCRGMLRVS